MQIDMETDFPLSGDITIFVTPTKAERFTMHLRIPGWSPATTLRVNGEPFEVVPGTYAEINRKWFPGDRIELSLDMRCRLIDAPHGSNRDGDHFQALVRGPVVLARDENFDENYNEPVSILAEDGYVELTAEAPTLESARMQFRVPTAGGFIHMVDYASVDSWEGKKICTWLPRPE